GDVGLSGLGSASRAPACVALRDRSTSRCDTADTMRIGVGARAMISFVASMPSMSGMCTSISTMSGSSCRVISTASIPFFASPTTRMSPSLSRIERIIARAVAESSASSTPRRCISTDQLSNGFQKALLVEARLEDVGVGTDLQPERTVFGAFHAGHEDDRNLREPLGRAHPSAQVEARHARHLDVAHHEVDRLLLQLLPGVLAVDRGRHVVARGLEHALLERARRDRVVDDEHVSAACLRLLGPYEVRQRQLAVEA